MNILNMTTKNIFHNIKVDEVQLRLENLHYHLAEHLPTQQSGVEDKMQRTREQIRYNEALYKVLTGKDFIYTPSRREAA